MSQKITDILVKQVHLWMAIGVLLGLFLLFGENPVNYLVSADLSCTPGPHSGTISADQRWCVGDNLHIISGGVTVNAGITLTIDCWSPDQREQALVISDGGMYIPSASKIFWSVGELGPKGTPASLGEVSFTADLLPGIPGGTPIFDRAVVHFPSVPEITPNNAVVNYIQEVTALPQTIETNYLTPVPVFLQGIDLGGAPLTFNVISQPDLGTLSGISPNLTYTPHVNQTGMDKFTYTASNGISASNAAEVAIIIHPSANDTLAPSILWTLSTEGAVAVDFRHKAVLEDEIGPIYAPFPIIQFSDALDAETVKTSNFSLAKLGGGSIEFSIVY